MSLPIRECIPVPTGTILIVEGSHGPLEVLSIGDYGKDVNIKADFLGLSRTPDPVRHTKLLPLTEKWVVTVSSQYGCSMNCTFCDVPRVGPGLNASVDEIMGQIESALSLRPEIEETRRLNVHFARMGEPTFNPAVIEATRLLMELYPHMHPHPVLSTMMPRMNKQLSERIGQWMDVKNALYRGNAGLQISVNSTNEDERREMFAGNACTLEEIGKILSTHRPSGRKITLNFAVADYEIDPNRLLEYFSPRDFVIKLTPMHRTAACEAAGIRTCGDYTTFAPYEHYERALLEVGYDVIVFIASVEEDLGRITCGNALLSGSTVDVNT